MKDFAVNMEEIGTYLVKVGVHRGGIMSLLKVGRQKKEESKSDQ